MKTIFKALGLGALLTAFLAVGSVSALAQEACTDVDAINALYQTVLDNYKSTDVAALQKAVDSGKQFTEKYGNCDSAKVNADWIGKQMPKWEARLAEGKVQAVRGPILTRFDNAIKSKNWDEAYAAGEEFTTKYPNDDTKIHIIVPLAWIGYLESGNKNTKYNANAAKYAKAAIDLLKSGTAKAKPSGGYGAFQFECASKDECISFLTYDLGYMDYLGGNKQAALPYYYEVTKISGSFKTNPVVFGTIGDYYYESVRKQAEDVKAKIADQKDTDPDDVKAKKDADIKQAVGMLNGYAERAMDAYSRAYTLAKADPKLATYAGTLYKTLQALYTVRFQKQDGIDAWISSTVTKPFPDPTSAVTPVIDPETTTSNATGGPGTGMGAANGTGMGAANGSGVGAANGTGTGNAAAAKTATAKPIKPRQ